MSDEIQSSEFTPLDQFNESYPIAVNTLNEDGPESDEFSAFSAEDQGRVPQAEDRAHRAGGTVPVTISLDEQRGFAAEGREPPPPTTITTTPSPPTPTPTTGELATMPTFQHKFPNNEIVAARIHPNGGGIVCDESQLGDDVYIGKLSTVYKSKIEDGLISRSSISECEIRTSNIIDSQLKDCVLSESCCNGLESNSSIFQSCTLTGVVTNSILKNTFLTGAEVDECNMEFCRLQGSYKDSTLKSCVIIGTVSSCEINNSEITRAQLKGVKGHIADTGRTKRVQYFIVNDADISQKIHITYRANQSITLELDLTAREFRSQVKAYMERIGALKFNEKARKREIDWLCYNYKSFHKEELAEHENSVS